MPDIVVTVPKDFSFQGIKGLAGWIAEGDAAGNPWSGTHWRFTTFGMDPDCYRGDRVYVVCQGKLRGYSPLLLKRFDRTQRLPNGAYTGWVNLIRGGDAVAVTIGEPVPGFRGWRYRWWEREQEVPFDDWQVP